MKYAKPFTYDYRRPDNAEKILKNTLKIEDYTILGFLDESSPQTTANTQLLLSFGKPTIRKILQS